MTRIILLRHGESEANLAGVFAGHSHVPLTARGHEQAEAAAAYIAATYPIDRIYTSDLRRASETAGHLAARLGMTPIPEPGLREIYAGEWEGQSYLDLASVYAEDYAVWLNRIGISRCTGGESFLELQERAIKTVRKIAAENENATVLLSTHAAFVRALVAGVKGLAPEEIHTLPWSTNCSVSIVDFDENGPRLTLYSHDRYLGEMASGLPKNV